MLNLPGYKIIEHIYEYENMVFYRGYSLTDGSPVVVKTLMDSKITSDEIFRLLHEYEFSRKLDIDGIVRILDMNYIGNFLAIVMEDHSAIPLREYMKGRKIDLEQVLDIGIQITKILSLIHQQGIIHRNLNPNTILINPELQRIYLSDFRWAIDFLSANREEILSTRPLANLEYLAPEQTGKLNSPIDQRSDLYSMGVIFYELLAAKLPFHANTVDDLVYAHMTQKPTHLIDTCPQIPHTISNRVMKLLEKSVEDRYQSAYGLMRDLEECKKCLKQMDKLISLPKENLESSPRLNISKNIVGREKERLVLEDAFNSVCNGQTKLVLVSGYPGVGKTTLVNKTLKNLVKEKGYFIAGKFDQLKLEIPYGPFAEAFGSLIKRLMIKCREEVKCWKKRILHAVGQNGAIVIKHLPMKLSLLLFSLTIYNGWTRHLQGY